MMFRVLRFIALWLVVIVDLGGYLWWGASDWLTILVSISFFVAGAYPDALLDNQMLKWISACIVIVGIFGEWIQSYASFEVLLRTKEYLALALELAPLVVLLLLLFRIIARKNSGKLIPEVSSIW